jgi:hypothetical protein
MLWKLLHNDYTQMLHTYKLTPDYFIRRALKAQTVEEFINANIGLYNMYTRRVEYHYQTLIESIFGKRNSKIK